MVFTTLLPFGLVSATNKDIGHEVYLAGSAAYPTRCPILFDHLVIYPFVKYSHWIFWAQNTCDRHRLNRQWNVYLKNIPEDSNMTEYDL